MIFQPQVVKCGLYATYKEHFSSNFRRAKEKRRRVEEGASKKRRKRENGAAVWGESMCSKDQDRRAFLQDLTGTEGMARAGLKEIFGEVVTVDQPWTVQEAWETNQLLM